MAPPELEFVRIAPTEPVRVGWRHDHAFDEPTRSSVRRWLFDPEDESLWSASLERSVTVEPFEIATRTFDWETFVDWHDETLEAFDTVPEFCDLLDQELQPHGWRLPTEDEFEIACGGGLFAWGDHVPDGVPHDGQTEFRTHTEPNTHGLFLNADTYKVEITRNALKLGDGGAALCGGYEWPIPWLSLSPAYHISESLLDETLFEYLEEAQIRPVRL